MARSRPTPGVPAHEGKSFREAMAALEDASWWLERLDLLYDCLRWTLLTGSPPKRGDWAQSADWPKPDVIEEVFGSWDDYLKAADVEEGTLARARAELDQAAETQQRHARQLEDEARKLPELRRQVEVARRKREEAEGKLGELEARIRNLEQAQDDAIARAERAEARADAAAAGDDHPALAQAAELERRLAEMTTELEHARRDRDHATRRTDDLERAAEDDAKTIARLTRLLADARGEEPPPEEPPDDADPGSVREAVDVAAAECENLAFAPSAYESADDSPYRRPREILDDLRALDRLGARYREGAMGTSLALAARDLGLDWRSDVSETARTMYANHYTFTYDGRKLTIGPHIAIGSGSVAGAVGDV